MTQLAPVYNSKVECPVCKNTFEVGKVRSKFVRSRGQDTDLRPLYEGENPLFYDAIVCPSCGFANIGLSFDDLTLHDFKAVREKISPKWTQRDFSGPRDVDQAIEAYKLALLNIRIRQGAASELAKACLRLSWMYRIKGDSVLDHKFTEFAFTYYQDAYMKEHLPVGKLDEFTVMYMIGELALRLEKYQDSLTWFSRLMSEAMRPENRPRVPPNLLDMARDQVQLAKDGVKGA
jgi:uncharacterized protein (DUF2225 family)